MHELIIEPGRAEKNYWRDLWRYRELFYFLAWRDILVRYKQTVIGIAWAVIRPLITTVVFTIVFGRLSHLPSPGDGGDAALAILFYCPQRIQQQPHWQCQPHFQSLFPAARRARRRGDH